MHQPPKMGPSTPKMSTRTPKMSPTTPKMSPTTKIGPSAPTMRLSAVLTLSWPCPDLVLALS